MNLSNYINDLLYRYECVILPGLGAFLTQYKPAHIDTESHTFYPPTKKLSFNKQLQANDGLLAHHIAKQDHIPYEKALEKLRLEVKNIKTQLGQGGTYTLKNIGELKENASSYLEFTPFQHTNFLTESFGLSSLTSPSLQREIKTPTSPKEVIVMNSSKTTHALLKYAAVGIIAFGVSGLVGLSLYNNHIKDYNLVEKQKANAVIDSQIQQATFIIDKPLSPIKIALNLNNGKYHLVAGAFREKENALTKIDQLKAKGFPARTIGKNKYGLHQVVYSSFENKNEALQQLRKVKLEDNKNAWLLVQDLN